MITKTKIKLFKVEFGLFYTLVYWVEFLVIYTLKPFFFVLSSNKFFFISF